jgi:hypothetical protein
MDRAADHGPNGQLYIYCSSKESPAKNARGISFQKKRKRKNPLDCVSSLPRAHAAGTKCHKKMNKKISIFQKKTIDEKSQ